MAQAHDHEPAQTSQPPAPGEPRITQHDLAAWLRLLTRVQRTRKVVLHAPGRARGRSR